MTFTHVQTCSHKANVQYVSSQVQLYLKYLKYHTVPDYVGPGYKSYTSVDSQRLAWCCMIKMQRGMYRFKKKWHI